MIDARELLSGREIDLSSSIGQSIFLMIFGAIFGGVPLAIIISEDAPIFIYIFPMIGAAVFFLGINNIFTKINLIYRSGILQYYKKGIFSNVSWSEPLKNYDGIEHKEIWRGSKNRRKYQVIMLNHDDEEKALSLYDERGHEMPRQEMENYAKLLKLPMFYSVDGKLKTRSHESVDRKIIDDVLPLPETETSYATEVTEIEALSRSYDGKDSSPSDTITYKQDRYSRVEESVYTITNSRISKLPFAVIILFFCIWLPVFFGYIVLGVIPLGYGAWALYQDKKFDRYIVIGSGEIRFKDDGAFLSSLLSKMRSSNRETDILKLADIEELDIHNSMNNPNLHIIGDHGVIKTGILTSHDDAKWLKGHIITEIKGSAR